MTGTPWPTHGPAFNTWNGDFSEFCALLNSVKDDPWWIMDMGLEYLTVRIDTRDNGFLLFADGDSDEKVSVSPDRVAEAIAKYIERFKSRRPTPSEDQKRDAP